jgi:molybdate transport system regulatory protein
MKIKYKIWIEKDGKVLFGSGREKLLQAVSEYNSLNAAAKELGMSYRGAWGRIKASEQRLDIKLLEHATGEPAHLTKEAKDLLKQFDILGKSLQSFLDEATEDLVNFINNNKHKNNIS